MNNLSTKRWPLHWLYAAFYRGPRTVAVHCKRRLLRLLNRFIDVEALRPRKPRKRTYWPVVERLEVRMVPVGPLRPVLPSASYATADQPQVDVWPIGRNMTVALLDGTVNDSVSLSGKGGTACGCTNPGLVLNYKGGSVAVFPTFVVEDPTDPIQALPPSVSVQLTLAGTAQATITYSTSLDSPGDTLVMDVRSTTQITATGAYSWSIGVTPAGGTTTTLTGTAYIAVSSSSEGYSAGNGWTFAGVSRLVSVSGGVIWKDGEGNGRFFASAGGGSYTSPPAEYGSLSYSSGTGLYTYTSLGGLYSITFDGSGYETNKQTADGQVTTFTRSGGELTKIQTPDGREVDFVYDSSGNLQSAQMPSGTATLTHDASGNLTVIERPDTTLLSFTYDGYSRVTDAQTPDVTSAFTYSSSGMLHSIAFDAADNRTVTPELSQALTHTVALPSAVAVYTDAQSRPTTVTLDLSGQDTQIVTADGTDQFSYDSNYNQLNATDALNRTTSFAYDGYGRETNITTPDGGVTTMAYDATLHLRTSSENPLGEFTTYTYTSTGDLQTTQDPTGAVTTNTWSGGLLQSTTDPNGHITSYVYDTHNDETAVIAPSGLRTSYTYDGAGNQTSVEQPDGTVTTTLYDAMGRPTGTINPDSSRVSTVYNGDGQVVSTSDTRGNLTTNIYDTDGRQTATVDPFGNRTSTVYDNAGDVSATVDQYGNRTSFAYDGAGRQISVEDQYGHISTTVYDAAGEVTATVNIYGQTTSFTYDMAGRQTSVTDPYGNISTSVYDAAGNLSASVDQYGNRTSFVYDAAGRQIATEDQYGHFSTTVYDSAGNVTAQVDIYGNRTSFIYDSYGRQSATEDQYGHYTTTVYDSYGRVQATVDIYGHATTTTFDSYGRVQATVDALGNRTSFAYDSYGEQNSTQTSLGYTTTVYDSYGRVQATEDPLGNFSTTVYDSMGRVQATVDALGNRTSFVFDSLGRPSASENALGNYTTTLYDSYGRVSATEDARGHYTSTIYDTFGRVSATENQLGNYTSTIYDSLGRVSATENALGQFTTTLYDSMGRVAGTEDGRGNTTSTIYDSYGRVAATENPLGQFSSTIYDSLGRVAATQNGNGGLTTTLYDGFGRAAGTEDPLGHIATTLYDSYGRQDGTQDPLAHITTSVLDSFGRQVNVIDASNNKTTFVYDADNRVINQVSPTGGVSTMVYDGDGHLTSQTSPTGTQITYAYDGIGENTGQTWYNADGTVNARLTFSYDGNGNQLTAQNSVGTYTMAYDAGNEVTSVQGLWGTVLTFSYDAGGNRSVTQDNFGGVTSYVHDANGNLTQEEFGGTNQTAMRIDLGYDKNNQLTSETRYSDLAGTAKVATTSIAYDGDGNRLNQLDLNGSGGNIANYTWTYDAADRLTTEKLNGGATVSYTYDNANELTGDGVTSPTYDATGNRSGAGYTVSTGNELTVDPNDTYSYDAAGEETKAVIKSSGNAWVYTYDPKGEVTKAQLLQYDPAIHGTGDPVLQEVDYKYDALGNMVERDYPTGTGSPVTRYALDGWDPALAGATGLSNFNVWAELDGNNSNALLTRYFHGDQVDQLFGRQDSKVAYWTLTDRLGSVRDVLDNSGNAKDAINYDGWGNILSGETGPSYRGSYAWTGRMFDVETDLQYNRARWYDPATGRWQTQDPLGFDAGDSNLYRYAINSPLDGADPNGLFFFIRGCGPRPGLNPPGPVPLPYFLPVRRRPAPSRDYSGQRTELPGFTISTCQDQFRAEVIFYGHLKGKVQGADFSDGFQIQLVTNAYMQLGSGIIHNLTSDFDYLQFSSKYYIKNDGTLDNGAAQVKREDRNGKSITPWEKLNDWYPDSRTQKSAYYERAGGPYKLTSNEFSMFDGPELFDLSAFGYKKIGYKFATFLVLNDLPVYLVKIDYSMDLSGKGAPTTNYDVTGQDLDATILPAAAMRRVAAYANPTASEWLWGYTDNPFTTQGARRYSVTNPLQLKAKELGL